MIKEQAPWNGARENRAMPGTLTGVFPEPEPINKMVGVYRHRPTFTACHFDFLSKHAAQFLWGPAGLLLFHTFP
jgi:hypothetical protein